MAPIPPLVEPQGWPDDATYDALIGSWSLYQRTRGHKTSTDDVLTAWLATRCVPEPHRYLDLGCGIGSVLLMTCYALRPGYAVGIEAQQQSVAMARASVGQLPGEEAIEVRAGDFRDALVPSETHIFDLITGSPPYFPVGAGTMSSDYQRAACRFELRGGVEAYCQAAAHAMTPQGTFVMVFQTQWEVRVLQAAAAVDLQLQRQTDVRMRVDRDEPFLSVYAFGREPTTVQRAHFAIRDATGTITPEYRSARAELGLSTAD